MEQSPTKVMAEVSKRTRLFDVDERNFICVRVARKGRLAFAACHGSCRDGIRERKCCPEWFWLRSNLLLIRKGGVCRVEFGIFLFASIRPPESAMLSRLN